MNNIYDLFNDRKSEIEAMCESSAVNEGIENEFDSIEEGLEYMDELIYESQNEMIEWQAACYMEDLVLEQMMYEEFDEEKIEYMIEGTMKERFADAGKKLSDFWEKVKKWFTSMIGKIQDYMSSGKTLLIKYGEDNITNALKNSDLQIKFHALGDPVNAIKSILAALDKLGVNIKGVKGAYQNALIAQTDLGVSDEKSLMTAIRKLIFKTEEKMNNTPIKHLNAEHVIQYAAGYDAVSQMFKKGYKYNEMTFKEAMRYGKEYAKAKVQENYEVQAYYYLISLRQKMMTAFLGAYNKAAMACRSIIIKVMGGGAAVKESALMDEYEEYLEEGIVNRMKMRKMSKEDMDSKIADLEAKIAELEEKEDRDKKDEKQLKKLRKDLADTKKVMNKKHPEPAQESYEYYEELYYLEEGLKDKIAGAKAAVGNKFAGMKEKHGEKKNNSQIAKKEKRVEQIRNRLEKARQQHEAELAELKQRIDEENEMHDAYEKDCDEEISKLMQEIEMMKNKIAEKKQVAQESFYFDESEIEVLEESLKEKAQELNEKVDDKIRDVVMKFKKNPDKLRAQIEKEREAIAKLEQLKEERGDDDAKWAKLKNILLYIELGGIIAKKKGDISTNRWINYALTCSRKFISRAEKRLAELEGGNEEAPAQESYFDFDVDDEAVEEGMVNRFKMRKMSKEEFDEKVQRLEARIAELEGMDERDKKQEKELKKLRKDLADTKKVMNKKHPEPAQESWEIDDIEFID